jgi:hypothetical protein
MLSTFFRIFQGPLYLSLGILAACFLAVSWLTLPDIADVEDRIQNPTMIHQWFSLPDANRAIGVCGMIQL